ncbi:zinc-binding dehydrogenase [Pseudotabrizicola sp.]|nr:zinc-binding dehydrogenase [Pseudotabrizicola sp.]MDP2079890.1 zinc-binding dehydrogenase [Pseudotabrizicola sp.]
MQAIVFDSPGALTSDTLLRDVPRPVALAGQVLIRVHRAGLNFADLMMRKGVYPHPKGYPLVAGLELSGVVEVCGEGVTGFAPGDRVAGFSENAGGFAAFCAVPQERLIRLPDAMSFDAGAAFYIQSLTAWHLLHTVSKTKAGDSLLIHAIGGGVGLQLTQLAKMAGAVVIGTVGTPGKEARALAFGADRVVNRTSEDFVSVCNEMTDGIGVDKIIDSTGATILDQSFDCVRRLGHIVSYGEAEGKPLPNLWERLVQKSLTFTRLHIGHLDNRSDAWRQGVDAVVGAIMAGKLEVPIAGSYGLEEAEAMFAALESRQTAGKLVLRIAD